jgi:hypothetical protein
VDQHVAVVQCRAAQGDGHLAWRRGHVRPFDQSKGLAGTFENERFHDDA